MQKLDHAGEQETSVLMHFHSELVNFDTASEGASKQLAIQLKNEKIAWAPRNWQQASEDARIGSLEESTAEKRKS